MRPSYPNPAADFKRNIIARNVDRQYREGTQRFYRAFITTS
jgi:hypothetical protein